MDVLGSAASQKSMSSYFIPKDSVLDQDEVRFPLFIQYIILNICNLEVRNLMMVRSFSV